MENFKKVVALSNEINQLKQQNEKLSEALVDLVWLIEHGATQDEIQESINAKAKKVISL